jgi:hypothetical protein
METKPVAGRVNERVYDWLEERAESEATTIGRIVEDELRESFQERAGSSDDSGESDLPKGVYVPDSDKYSFAVKWRGHKGKTRRDYYKTREGALGKVERVREADNNFQLLSV